MNLIENCCIGGDYYNVLKQEYNNPFIWVIMKPADMLSLIKNFDKVNFDNIEIYESEFSTATRKCFKIKVDNLFEIHYPHYLKDARYKTVTRCSDPTKVDVLCANIEDYVKETYFRRVKRMRAMKEKPKFLILGDRDGYKWNVNDIEKLDACTTSYKICLISDIKYDEKLKHIHLIKANSKDHYQARIKNDLNIRNVLGISYERTL